MFTEEIEINTIIGSNYIPTRMTKVEKLQIPHTFLVQMEKGTNALEKKNRLKSYYLFNR